LPEQIIDPARSALLIMDFQPAILGAVGSQAEPLLSRAKAGRDKARVAGMQVVYVRVAFTDQDYGSISARNKAFSAIARGGMLAEGSPEAAIHPDLAPQEGDVVVTKTRHGAFSTTNLVTHLHGRDVDTLFLAGVSTSGVVLSTVRDAADRDFRLHVISDCCADPNADVHQVLFEHVFPGQADVIDLDAFTNLLSA
jgi:nicotinamidase-related amidase